MPERLLSENRRERQGAIHKPEESCQEETSPPVETSGNCRRRGPKTDQRLPFPGIGYPIWVTALDGMGRPPEAGGLESLQPVLQGVVTRRRRIFA
jgi:hypothetical protein